MTEVEAYDVISDTVLAVLLASGPVLGVALVIGLVIAFFQALTQIQEMTLTFVPKLAAIVGTFWITMNYMTETLVSLFQGTLIPIIAGG